MLLIESLGDNVMPSAVWWLLQLCPMVMNLH